MDGRVKVTNKYLAEIDIDHFHHMGFSTADVDIKKAYSDVKFICISGSGSRVLKFAQFLQKDLLNIDPGTHELKDLCRTDRYVMYKVGPVLSVSHGMGIPSITIILHELIKLLYYAEAKNVVLFRLGTSGGIGVKSGTVVVTKKVVDGLFRGCHEQIVLGKVVQHNTELDSSIADELVSIKNDLQLDFDVVPGDTMCCDDFYEGQARLIGAFCHFTEEEKLEFLKKAYEAGIRNMEMEGLAVASMCSRAKIRAGILCTTYLDRLKEDSANITAEEKKEYQTRPWKLVSTYIKKHM